MSGGAEVTVVRAERGRWDEGVRVVLEVQAATGLPDPVVWPPELLAIHTLDRQVHAIGVWLALVDNVVVGHALVKPVPAGHRDWSVAGDEAVDEALRFGTMVELGGLAVTPAWQRHGVAGALVSARLEWIATQPNLLAGASIWHHSPGSNALARRYARNIGPGATGPYDLFVYDRAPAVLAAGIATPPDRMRVDIDGWPGSGR